MKLKKTILLKIAEIFGPAFLRVLKSSLKIELVNSDIYEQTLMSHKKAIFLSWHGKMMLPILVDIGKGTYVLASQHGDGEIISRILDKLKYNTIRGSSTRGGKEAMATMVEVLKNGDAAIGITPDGPQGPRHEMKIGPIVLAQRSGAPIIPVGCYFEKKKVFGSWDKFELPKPFSKAVMVYGDQICIGAELGEEDLEKMRKDIELKMKEITDKAKNIA